MIIGTVEKEFGVDARNNSEAVKQSSIDGALAGLETFYYSFNNRDLVTLKKVWYNNVLIQLNNPIGGIVRGIDPIIRIYDKIFNGQSRVWVKFSDIIYYATAEMVVFAGTETGEFSINGDTTPLTIRTSRIFCYLANEKSWFQVHHHGSIDNADLLHRYQNAVKK